MATKKAAPTRKAARKPARRARRKSILQLVRESWFYRIYFGVLAICAIALIIGLNVLTNVMREYEQTRPIHCAQETFALIEQGDWAEILAIDESAKKLRFDSTDGYLQYMDELTRGKEFTLKSILSVNDDEQKYNVLLDGQKFAAITLGLTGESTPHNFPQWTLKRFETLAFQGNEFTVTAPSNCTVQVNGQTLTQEDAVQTDIATEADGNLPDGVPAPTLTKYSVSLALGEPESITVTDANGNPMELTQDSERSWSCGLAYDDSVKPKVEEEVIKWSRRLAAYTTGDYNKFDLSNACVNPSPARTYIRNMENQWAAAHSGYSFQNIETHDYYVYSNSCFSCKVSFDYIVHYTKGNQTYPTKYTLYFAKDGGKFKLYSFTMD